MGLPTKFKTLRKYSFQEVQAQRLDIFQKDPAYGVVLVDWNATYLFCMSCVSAEDTLHTGEHDMIIYTYIWTKLIQIFIIISLIFNEFHTVKCRYLIAFIP